MGFGRVGVLYNGRIPQARSLAAEIEAWICQRVERVQVSAIEEILDALSLPELDLLLAVGGDGSILQAARLAAPHRVPILGINLGRVGFLTEAETDGWKAVLEHALIGDYWVEERIMLRVWASRGDEVVCEAHALNDAVVGRHGRGRAVHLRAEVDGGELATYVADGLIVATPTGSTAYALAAGGPILPPQLRNILLVPVAPHLSMDRPIVLAEGVTVRITVVGRRPAVLMVDGQVAADLENRDAVSVEASTHVARFARVRERTYFYKTLVSRLVPRNDR
ncbi:MAG: NAD(+)/NADH kinase [Anaerolineae bacterium]|jgi:NAD+ kinase